MKKLLSICFLSILLGLLSFSTQAQSNNGSNSCASGFWIENLQPTTIHDIVNLPADMPNTGDLPLTHTLGQLWYGSTGQYLGNAHPGQTELYELHFCNTCNLDPKTKVSIDWLVIRDGDTINDHLSDYMEFSIYTFYNQLNQYGQCQSIGWMGGQVNDGFGYCEPVSGNYTLYDSIHGLNTGCHTPTNYPGALQVTQGTPLSVMTQLGQVVPAMGLNHVYTEALDYFYLDFFTQTRNIVQIKWKQVGDYKLVMRIRERTGGTAYNNLNWNDNETTDFIGGHQSCCGNVIAEDVISFPSFGESCMEVCENETYTVGRPAYTFTQTTPDTNVVFGQYVFDGTNCKYFQADSIYKFHFYERHTPQVVVLKSKDTLCRCESFTTAQLAQMIKFDTVDFQYASDHYFLWNHGTAANPTWLPEFPTLNNNLGTHTYQVLQVNKYSTCGFDTLCTGNPVTLTITFVEMQVPTITAPTVEYCLDWIVDDNTLQFTATSTPDPRCATTTRWYTTLNSELLYGWIADYPNYRKLSNIVTSSMLAGQGNDLAVNLADYVPSTNKDTVLYFFATSYDPVLDCESPNFSFITVKLYQTPVLAPHITKTVYCPGSEVEMQVTINNGTSYNAPDYTYRWGGDVTEVKLDGTRVPATAMQVKTVGTGTYNSSYLPLYSYNKRTYSQQIFTPAEVGTGIISKIAFQNATTGTLANYVRDVKIYLALSDDETFSTNSTYGKEWCTEGMQLVYQGQLDCRKSTEEWLEVPFTTPYQYDGSKNLVVVVHDQTNGYASGVKFLATAKSQAAMYATADGLAPNPADIAKGSRNVYGYRNNIKFYVESEGFTTSAKNQYAYYQMDPTDSCKTAYTTTAYVIDGHGCKSAPVSFNYIANDTVNPTVSVATVTTNVNACHLNTTNAPIYTTVAELEAGANVTFSDNCDHQFLHIDGVTSVVNSISDTTCHEVVTRTYTIKDHCGNPVTFTQVFVSQDTVKPSFVTANGAFPYVRLFPVEGGNCTFNSPDSMTFVNAVAPFVHDNCTDSAYLMSTVKFTWENNTESPIGKTNIFINKNHLTVNATITDRCGNTTTAMVIYIDRPMKLYIDDAVNSAISGQHDICEGGSVTLKFDTTFIKDDTISGPFVPYTYEWYEVNGRAVTFTPANDTVTTVTFAGTGDYTFAMRVTDRNGCFTESRPVTMNVRTLPHVVINQVPETGKQEPYCPTYGNLTVVAQLVNPVAGQTVSKYVWTGESVNIHSVIDTTWVTIVPDWCDTVYYPTVTVTDDRGCVNSYTDTVDVTSPGPQFKSTIPDTTLVMVSGCKFVIPDFKPFIDASMVEDECYTFSQLKYDNDSLRDGKLVERKAGDAHGAWFKQEPAYNTPLTTDQGIVKLIVTNWCGISDTLEVVVKKPADQLTVSVNPTSYAVCQDEIENVGVVYHSTVENAHGTVTYNWKAVNAPTILSHSDSLEVKEAKNPGNYSYVLNITDALGCPATSNTVNLTVYYQGADPIFRTWPNTLCERRNGAIAIDTAPTGYAYRLTHDNSGVERFKTSDVPEHHDQITGLDWNTIVFDSLDYGWYSLRVYTDHDCERYYPHHIYVDNIGNQAKNPAIDTVGVSVCNNNNGQLTIHSLAGYTYSVYHNDADNTDFVGNALTYNNLSAGKYRIHSVQNSTHCYADTTVTITYHPTELPPTVTASQNNTLCDENGNTTFNGVISLQNGYTYTVFSLNGVDTTWYTVNNNKVSGLYAGKYYYTAYNPANGCNYTGDVQVNNNFDRPKFTYTSTPNHYCADTADGTITVTNANKYLHFELKKGADSIADNTSTPWVSLYEGTYTISGYTTKYCTVSDTVFQIQKETVTPIVLASSTKNQYCNPAQFNGSIKLEMKKWTWTTTDKTKRTDANIGNTSLGYYSSIDARSYNLNGSSYDSTIVTTANNVTYSGLNSGDYNYSGISSFNCPSTVKSIHVDQYELPTMILDSTPNHMCAPTFTKPGDGTITIIRPTNISNPGHTYEYKFYDAAGNEMTVPYDLPLTHTKYWLAAQKYRVVAYEPATGCSVEDSITVLDDLYTVDFDFTTTRNYICNTSTVGNGSITVVNPTSTNPDANLGVFVYSMDGTNYQSNPTFTGLKDGVYTVYVKDTTYQCEKIKNNIVVNSTDSCAPVITICDNNGLCGDQFDYCIGSNAQLCGTVNDTCNPANTYSYAWYAPCSDPSTSNTNCINVQTDHYVVNSCDYHFTATNTVTGCSYTKTVHVAIHPNPVLVFTINGLPATQDQRNWFCENEPLHIAVHSNNPDVILDTTSITWTQGIVGTGFTEFDTIGTKITGDHITFCVRANSEFGCPSGIASLPVSFVRTDTINFKDTVCSSFLAKADDYDNPADVTITPASYPFDTIVVRKYVKSTPVHGQYCDSVEVHNVRIVAAPVMTPAAVNVDPFCESAGHTLADFVDRFSVAWNGDTTGMKWIAAPLYDTVYTFSRVNNISDITDGKYIVTNQGSTLAMVNEPVNETTAANYALKAVSVNMSSLSNPAANMVWDLTINSDGSYSFSNAGKYIGGSSSNIFTFPTTITDVAKWTIYNSWLSSGNRFYAFVNSSLSGRYIKCNARFASYGWGSAGNWIALYKVVTTINPHTPTAADYVEVADATALTYDYVTTHDIKRVASNCCGADTSDITFTVYKQPAINTFNVSNPYCASNTYDFTANVSTYGTQATAKLYIEGNTTPLATKTVNGLNQTVTFNNIKTPKAYNGKNLTLEVVNTNGFCDAVTAANLLTVDTAEITGLANTHTYCVGDVMDTLDFTGTGFVPSNYTSLTLKHMLNTAPATTDPVITLPYTFADRSLNGQKVYFVATNSCYSNIVSNAVTLTVNAKPVVTGHTDINQCASSFTALPDMPITWNESYDAAICDSGWLLKGASGSYASATFNQIKTAATCPNVAHVGYFAHGFCGNDTTFFDITLATLPTVSLAIGTQCPDTYVWDSLTTNTMSYNCSPVASNSDSWTFTKADGTSPITWLDPSTSTLTFAAVKTAGYDGGTLTHSATNSCGTTTASVTINVLTNTYTNATYKYSCDGDTLGAFVATAPVWTGTASVGNTGKWQIKIGSTTTDATLATVINYADNPQVAYTWTTQCGDVVTTPFAALEIHKKPAITKKTVAAVCAGQSINPTTAIDHINYYGNEADYDTTYTINGNVITTSTPLPYSYNGEYLVITLNDNGQACGVVKDSVVITINPIPNPTITGPAKACADMPLSTPFTAGTGYINYVFTVKGDATPTPATQNGPSNTYNPVFSLSTPLSSAHDTVYVTVTDLNGCIGTSSTPAIIRVTNAPEFIFKDSTGTETHTFSTMTGGDGLSYTWLVGVDCYAPDKLVYVEYDIYYNDVLIPNANIGDYLNTQHTAATPGHPAKDFVTKNYYEWCATDGTPRSDEILYNYSMANPSIGESGNHFPYSNLGLGTGHNYLDDLWLSFLAERPVKKTFVPFLRNGEYKVVYRLIATDNNQQLNEYYSPTCASITDLFPIGGHSALSSGYAQTLLAIDSITIHVGGPNLTPSTDPTNEEPVTPELAPVISNVETVAPDMEVWPNPAPAVETTLKARVHNMSGDATVTLTSLTGKQVYSGNIYIDNDNYYFEFNVNSLSVGSYIMTVRTDADVITKKVIVSRLAK